MLADKATYVFSFLSCNFLQNFYVLNLQIFGQVTVGSGHDLTLSFDWIHGKYANNNASINSFANHSDFLYTWIKEIQFYYDIQSIH